MPPNYEALRETPPPVAPHQRRWMGVIGALVLLSGVGVGVWALTESGGPAGPCVTVVLASSTGGIYLEHCGADARRWCASEATVASQNAVAASKIRAACRRAGFVTG
jgi:hypothetical protein